MNGTFLNGIKPVEVPYAYYTEVSRNKKSVDKFIEKESPLSIFLLGSVIFVSLFSINIPFAFFYTAVFLQFNSYKNTNYGVYYKFMLSSIFMFGYFVLLMLSFLFIDKVCCIHLGVNHSSYIM